MSKSVVDMNEVSTEMPEQILVWVWTEKLQKCISKSVCSYTRNVSEMPKQIRCRYELDTGRDAWAAPVRKYEQNVIFPLPLYIGRFTIYICVCLYSPYLLYKGKFECVIDEMLPTPLYMGRLECVFYVTMNWYCRKCK